MLQTIESDTPFDVVFLDFWGPGDIPYQNGYLKILTFLYCMKGFGVGAATVLKEITSGQAGEWAFGKCFVTFGIPKMIVVDADALFAEIFKNNF